MFDILNLFCRVPWRLAAYYNTVGEQAVKHAGLLDSLKALKDFFEGEITTNHEVSHSDAPIDAVAPNGMTFHYASPREALSWSSIVTLGSRQTGCDL